MPILVLVLLMIITSCMTADPLRHDGLDGYDRKVAVAPVRALKMTLSPEGHLVVMMQFAHVFTMSEPDPYWDRYASRGVETRLYVFDGESWRATPLQGHFDWSRHNFGFYASNQSAFFDFDVNANPVFLGIEKLSPVILAYRNREWQTIWRGATDAQSPKNCPSEIWYADGKGSFSLCVNTSSQYSTSGSGQDFRQVFQMRMTDSFGKSWLWKWDTLATQIYSHRIKSDTLDFITLQFPYSSSLSQDSGRVTWNRIIRKPGNSFADSNNTFLQRALAKSTWPGKVYGDARHDFLIETDSGRVRRTLYWQGDSLVWGPTEFPTKDGHQVYYASRDCIRGVNALTPTLPSVEDSFDQKGMPNSPNRSQSQSINDTLTYHFQSSCGDAPTSLTFVNVPMASGRRFSVESDSKGRVSLLHQVVGTNDEYYSTYYQIHSQLQSASEDSLEVFMRREFKSSLHQWDGQAWKTIAWPF